VLLLRCLRNKGAKMVYIPVNRNRNQKKFAIITFANAQKAEAAQTTPIWYNNHRVSWKNPRRRKTYEREESRGRSQERSKSNNEKQLNYRRQGASRIRGSRHETPIKRYGEMESDPQLQNIEAWLGDKNTDMKKEAAKAEEKKAKMNVSNQERILPVEDVLFQILERLDRIEEMQLGWVKIQWIAPKVALVELRNTDKEIEAFLQKERRMFEEKEKEASPYLREKKRKATKKVDNTELRQEQLKEKWKERRKEIKIACHNINGLKTKGWKLENLLDWAEEEEIAILGITETNIVEKERRFLAYAANKKYVGYWTNAAEDKKKGSGIGILIEEQ